MSEPCVFCQIVAGEAPAEIVNEWDDAIAIRPLNPVAPGHILVLPKKHVANAGSDPEVTAKVMYYAAWEARFSTPCNIITSLGAEATQTVMHLHIHVVPRFEGDGLALPWTGQHR